MLADEQSTQCFVLRYSAAPYLAFAFPLMLVTALGGVASFTARTFSFFGYFLVPWAFYATWVLLLRRYVVSFTPKKIFRRAAGLQPISIDIDAIRSVRLETRGADELLSIRRPFRRISIYAGKSGDGSDFIDVSLKHFVAADIRLLMRAIHTRRPDLPLPRQWL
jgi:hypothetical protein